MTPGSFSFHIPSFFQKFLMMCFSYFFVLKVYKLIQVLGAYFFWYCKIKIMPFDCYVFSSTTCCRKSKRLLVKVASYQLVLVSFRWHYPVQVVRMFFSG